MIAFRRLNVACRMPLRSEAPCGKITDEMPPAMKLDDLLYTYKTVGIVEKDGVKYKKVVKVPRLRSKHKAAAGKAFAVAVLVAAAFKAFGWFLERGSHPVEDRPPGQSQGF